MKSPSDLELRLQLQAWIDGELGPSESGSIAQRVEKDSELRALADNLRRMSEALRTNQPIHAVPEARDFYFSRIRRGIEQAEAETSPTSGGSPLRWLGWLLPVGAAALAAVLMLRPMHGVPPSGIPRVAITGHVVETPSEELSSLTYYASQDGMTVVWLGTIDLL